jgi:fructose-1,6-bisphosphatase I
MQDIYEAIKKSAIQIRDLIEEATIEKTATQNSTGDTQMELDVLSDEVIEANFKQINSIKKIVSEEKDSIEDINDDGKYLIAYDPLDGSSLIDVNLSIGSIFGIYTEDFTGNNLIASVYVVYGPRVELVIADENKDIKLYRLFKGDFVFIKDLKLNAKGNLNAPGSTQKEWYPHHKKLVQSLFDEGYRLRYSGGMVPDLHQILLKGGGLFSYPATGDKTKGKLRQLFEVFPFAFIFECAGGSAIDGQNRVLEIETTHIHDTSPCFFGSNYEIDRVKEYYK